MARLAELKTVSTEQVLCQCRSRAPESALVDMRLAAKLVLAVLAAASVVTAQLPQRGGANADRASPGEQAWARAAAAAPSAAAQAAATLGGRLSSVYASFAAQAAAPVLQPWPAGDSGAAAAAPLTDAFGQPRAPRHLDRRGAPGGGGGLASADAGAAAQGGAARAGEDARSTVTVDALGRPPVQAAMQQRAALGASAAAAGSASDQAPSQARRRLAPCRQLLAAGSFLACFTLCHASP